MSDLPLAKTREELEAFIRSTVTGMLRSGENVKIVSKINDDGVMTLTFNSPREEGWLVPTAFDVPEDPELKRLKTENRKLRKRLKTATEKLSKVQNTLMGDS